MESRGQSGIVIVAQQPCVEPVSRPRTHAISGAVVHKTTALNMTIARLVPKCIVRLNPDYKHPFTVHLAL